MCKNQILINKIIANHFEGFMHIKQQPDPYSVMKFSMPTWKVAGIHIVQERYTWTCSVIAHLLAKIGR